MRTDRPIGVDLFAGAGGLSLGFEQAGFDVLTAVEIDPVHASVHHYNFPECAVIPKSVQELTGPEIRAASSIGDRPVDVVFGGAPCQGFSLIGKRALDDPRNALVKDFVRIVAELEAGYFVFENVKGLTVGRHRKFLDELMAEFESAGYDVVADWKVLNASSYGVPQNRERLFLLGARRGLPLPGYPEPTTLEAGASPELLLPNGPSCREALEDLPDAESFEQLLTSDGVTVGDWAGRSPYARLMRCDEPESWYYGYKRLWERERLTSSMRTDHTPVSRVRFAETLPGTVEPISRFFKLNPRRASNTLRAGTDASRGAFTSPRPIHYKYNRCITVREMARLHGFPDWFRFHCTKWHGARQIGNAVPPPLARAVAASVIAAMGMRPARPRRMVDLGNSGLLKFDMREAANHWNVPPPPGKRDRKSGATKRSQSETEAERLRKLAS